MRTILSRSLTLTLHMCTNLSKFWLIIPLSVYTGEGVGPIDVSMYCISMDLVGTHNNMMTINDSRTVICMDSIEYCINNCRIHSIWVIRCSYNPHMINYKQLSLPHQFISVTMIKYYGQFICDVQLLSWYYITFFFY